MHVSVSIQCVICKCTCCYTGEDYVKAYSQQSSYLNHRAQKWGSTSEMEQWEKGIQFNAECAGRREGNVEGRMTEIRRKIISGWSVTNCNFSGRTAVTAPLWQHQKVRERLSSLGHPGTIAASAWILGLMCLEGPTVLGTGFGGQIRCIWNILCLSGT